MHLEIIVGIYTLDAFYTVMNVYKKRIMILYFKIKNECFCPFLRIPTCLNRSVDLIWVGVHDKMRKIRSILWIPIAFGCALA